MKKITLLVALTFVLSTALAIEHPDVVGWVQCSDGTVVKTNVECSDYKGGEVK